MAVPANICIAWPSTAASIPAGWTRETALDARYILGAAAGSDTDLVTDRGSATHTHTSPSHVPTQNAHTHDFQTSTVGGGPDSTIVTGAAGGNGASDIHGHDAATSSSTTAVNDGVAITVNATTNDLAFIEVIWIKSNGTPSALPLGCLAFFASDSLPASWSRVHGDRYLKGAAGGADGGATGGSNTHTHTSPSHTHTQTVHSHTGTTPGANSITLNRGSGTDLVSSTAHTHTVTLDATAGTNQSVTTTINAGSHEPPFKKLNVVQAAADSLPDQIVALWLGTNATIPTDWTRFTSMDDKWLKGAAVNGESNVTTGGSSQHNHTADDCQPTQNAHTHVVTDTAATATSSATPGGINTFAANNHRHAAWDCTSVTPTNNAVAVTIDLCTADAALPKHRTLIYIQYNPSAGPGPSLGGVTTYDIGFPPFGANEEQLGGKPLPEVLQKRWAGDSRYFPHEPML